MDEEISELNNLAAALPLCAFRVLHSDLPRHSSPPRGMRSSFTSPCHAATLFGTPTFGYTPRSCFPRVDAIMNIPRRTSPSITEIMIPIVALLLLTVNRSFAEELPGTSPLEMEGDIAAQLVDGVDKFLLRELRQSAANREGYFDRDFTSPQAYEESLSPNRERLAKILGVRDPRIPLDSLEFVATTSQPHLIDDTDRYEVHTVRWPVIRHIHGEGIWLVPHREPIADVIAIPDADQTPEMICGLTKGLDPEYQFARQLAENGCRVLVPTLINREYKARNGRATMTSREYLYRSSYELGRHLIGYEVQKVLSCVDFFTQQSASQSRPIGVIGYGEGGMIAMYASALDTRIDATCVSGYFGSRQKIWEQPISRNVFGLLEQFGDAELAAMIVPRKLILDTAGGPTLTLPSEGGAQPFSSLSIEMKSRRNYVGSPESPGLLHPH